MKLCECRIGVLVAVKPDELQTDELRIGHVIGLTTTGSSPLERIKHAPGAKFETIPVVMFAGNVQGTAIHHDKLDLFTAY